MDRDHSAYVVDALSGISASLEKLNLSRRDMIAGMALQGILSGRHETNRGQVLAVQMADALIAELYKPKES